MSDSEKPTLLVVDGHSLAFRAFYALPVDSFVNSAGQHTNAIHGFLSMLLSLLRNEKPSHLAVAFDLSRYSFRTREYPEYKGTRAETPPEFKGQIPLLEEALRAMNITTLSKEDYEADDILATLARRGAEEGYRVLVVSGDRDTFQLIRPDVTVLYPNVRGVSELKRYDRDAVVERYGIEPEQYPEVAALVGETSDNLIGIDKVGEKTAVKWVQKYGTLDEILAHADEITGVVGRNLREQRENALRNRRLNRLVDDLELATDLDRLERRPFDEEAVREVFGRLEFRRLLERVLAAADDDGLLGGQRTPTSAPEAPTPARLLDEELALWLESVEAGTPVAVTLETSDAVTGLGLATTESCVTVPWAANRPDYAALEAWLASDAPKIVFDAKATLGALARAGLPVAGVSFDPRLAARLNAPGSPAPTFEMLVEEVLGHALATPDPAQLVPEEPEPEPAVRAWHLARLTAALEPGLEEGTRSILDTIELPLAPVLVAMEQAGIAIDRDTLGTARRERAATADELAQQAFSVLGHEVNLGSPKQLQQVLFDELGMPKTRSTKTGYSTDAAAIAELRVKNPHPFLDLLLAHRDATKLKQIIESLEKSVREDGRIHTRYDQLGASTGRISSTDPNLQNIPIRSAEGRRIRTAFVHGSDYETLLTVDYSQIEMRIMAHLSEDPGLIEAFHAGEDLHRYVGSHIFGVAPGEVTGEMRSKVKAMSYGLAYGLSAFGLSRQLNIPTGEATALMADYFERFGAVRDYLRGVVERARSDGYTETIFGRRRPFPELSSPNRTIRENAERAALNAPIQGSAADIMKIAMIDVAADMRRGGLASRMLLQVHDELIFEVAEGEFGELSDIVRHRMTTAAELRVPLDVQIGRGANWDAAAH